MGWGGLWLGENFDPKWEAPTAHEVVRSLQDSVLATNYAGLEQLARSKFGKKHIQFDTSFDRPLSFIAEVLKCGHPWMKKTFNKVIEICEGVRRTHFGITMAAENRGDDMIRKTLQLLEDSIAATSPVAKVCFSGMSTLGGPRGWDREEVVASVRSWVSGDTTLFSTNAQRTEAIGILKKWGKSWVGQGVLGDARKLGFQAYTTDFMRWGTPGGCSPTQAELEYAIKNGIIQDKSEKNKLRSKTICGMLSVLVGDTDNLLGKTNVCHAALKEEVKTRVIISTPMWSYVRMCYVLDCLGKPNFLNSTLSRHDLVVQFTKFYSMHYAAIDASRFDHNVPKWLLKEIWNSIIEAVVERYGHDDELATLCMQLRDELDDLYVEVFGQKIKYEKGLLSGWRVTSLFGSMISALCCEMYLSRTCASGRPRSGVGYLTQGDDVILWSCQNDFSDAIGIMQQLGVVTHASKCLIGGAGDFLRGLYTQNGKLSYPMRALRGIFYAHPWIERRQYQGISEISSNWLQVISRLQLWRERPDGTMFNIILHEACADIARWGCGLRASQIKRLFNTPISLGGLGSLEMDCGGAYHTYEGLTRPTEYGRAFSDMLGFVGVRPDNGYRVKEVTAHYVDMVAINRAAEKLSPFSPVAIPTTTGMHRGGLLLHITARTATGKEKQKAMFKDIHRSGSALLGDEGVSMVNRILSGMYGRTTRRGDIIRLLFGGQSVGLTASISLDYTVAREKLRWAVHLAEIAMRSMVNRISKTKVVAASWTVYLSMMRTDATFGQL